MSSCAQFMISTRKREFVQLIRIMKGNNYVTTWDISLI